MKKLLFCTLLCAFGTSVNSQVFFERNIITEGYLEATSISAADFDGDGDLDVLTASINDKISWFENLDGLGNFGGEMIVSTECGDVTYCIAADINGDNFIDIVSISNVDGILLWYENLNGLGVFGEPNLINSDVINGRSVIAGDFDGDNDLDLLSADQWDGKIAWYENLDGQGNFGGANLISDLYPTFATSVDMDGDGDLDVLASIQAQQGILIWFENLDGLGNFGSSTIIADEEVTHPRYVCAGDLNGDNKIDVLSSNMFGVQDVFWYEHLDGQGTFGSHQVITTEVNQPFQVHSVNLDNDEDLDVISVSWNDNKVAWYENLDGQGNFGPQKIVEFNAGNPSSVYPADIDGDGKIDVLTTSTFFERISWNKQVPFLSTNDIHEPRFVISPNPTSGIIEIESQKEIEKVHVFNQLGQQVLWFSSEETIDVSNLENGLYFVKVIDSEGSVQVKRIIKE
ncbi:MAG: T9SS type A sorting domain-containing protein [Flavobacteriaceae bacterium]|nr:T9SS type A sorting domain-containing protein [Flavobacteriaceae bacterium]